MYIHTCLCKLDQIKSSDVLPPLHPSHSSLCTHLTNHSNEVSHVTVQLQHLRLQTLHLRALLLQTVTVAEPQDEVSLNGILIMLILCRVDFHIDQMHQTSNTWNYILRQNVKEKKNKGPFINS